MKVFLYLQLKLEEPNIHIRMEIIAYIPDALYPCQLIDASQVFEYPRSTGIPFRTSSQATPQPGAYSPILMSSSAYKPIAGEIKLSCGMQTCNSSMLWDLARPRRLRFKFDDCGCRPFVCRIIWTAKRLGCCSLFSKEQF